MEELGNVSYDMISNRFLFVLLSAKRALQLQKGARPRLEFSTKKPTIIAMAEVISDKVQFELPDKRKDKALTR